MASNEAVGSYSIKIFNDNIHDTWMNTCWNLRRVVEKMKTEIKIFMPQDDNDKEFRKQIFQVTVDSEKAIDSIYNNYMTKTIMKGIFDSMDFDMPKFPLQKVFCFFHFEFDWSMFHKFPQGNYTQTNMTFSDELITFPLGKVFTAVVQGRFYGKLLGKKGSVHFFTFRGYATRFDKT